MAAFEDIHRIKIGNITQSSPISAVVIYNIVADDPINSPLTLDISGVDATWQGRYLKGLSNVEGIEIKLPTVPIDTTQHPDVGQGIRLYDYICETTQTYDLRSQLLNSTAYLDNLSMFLFKYVKLDGDPEDFIEFRPKYCPTMLRISGHSGGQDLKIKTTGATSTSLTDIVVRNNHINLDLTEVNVDLFSFRSYLGIDDCKFSPTGLIAINPSSDFQIAESSLSRIYSPYLSDVSINGLHPSNNYYDHSLVTHPVVPDILPLMPPSFSGLVASCWDSSNPNSISNINTPSLRDITLYKNTERDGTSGGFLNTSNNLSFLQLYRAKTQPHAALELIDAEGDLPYNWASQITINNQTFDISSIIPNTPSGNGDDSTTSLSSIRDVNGHPLHLYQNDYLYISFPFSPIPNTNASIWDLQFVALVYTEYDDTVNPYGMPYPSSSSSEFQFYTGEFDKTDQLKIIMTDDDFSNGYVLPGIFPVFHKIQIAANKVPYEYWEGTIELFIHDKINIHTGGGTTTYTELGQITIGTETLYAPDDSSQLFFNETLNHSYDIDNSTWNPHTTFSSTDDYSGTNIVTYGGEDYSYGTVTITREMEFIRSVDIQDLSGITYEGVNGTHGLCFIFENLTSGQTIVAYSVHPLYNLPGWNFSNIGECNTNHCVAGNYHGGPVLSPLLSKFIRQGEHLRITVELIGYESSISVPTTSTDNDDAFALSPSIYSSKLGPRFKSLFDIPNDSLLNPNDTQIFRIDNILDDNQGNNFWYYRVAGPAQMTR